MELQNDLNDLDQLETTHVKRGRGRPRGSKDGTASARQTRLRVRAWREKQTEEAAELARSQEKLFEDQRTFGLTYLGETQPCVNCVTIDEEVAVARSFATALHISDIHIGETPRQFITRVVQAWIEIDCPLYHRESGTFSARKIAPPDINEFQWLAGADTPFQDQGLQQIAVRKNISHETAGQVGGSAE